MNRTELFVVLAQIWLGMHGCELECLVGDDAINNSALHESRSTRKLCSLRLHQSFMRKSICCAQ
jgi:hypothetical protein